MRIRDGLYVIMSAAVVSVFLFAPFKETQQQRLDTQPLGTIGSGLKLPEQTSICVEISQTVDLNQWPIHNATYNWNRNGLNLFLTGDPISCSGTVVINQVHGKQAFGVNEWWGLTEFLYNDMVLITLSDITPRADRLATICHELGHVLGLPHSFGDGSCMDPTRNNPNPTQQDLNRVSVNPWKASVAKWGIN